MPDHRPPSLPLRWLPRAALFACVAVASDAHAYRPFDGTDGDVAELGAFELELGPAHWYTEGGRNYLLAPATVLNFGLLPRTELVIDFQDRVALGAVQGRPRLALLGTDVLVKHVFREGVLQGQTGLSIAAEAGPLTPEVNGTNAFGASANLILSDRWSWGTIHFNEWPQYSRAHNLDLTTDVIVEGPREWPVRPVGEVYYEKEFNAHQTVSGLAGAIWPVRDDVVLDLALRCARIDDATAGEVRFGITWTIAMWDPNKGTEGPTATHASR